MSERKTDKKKNKFKVITFPVPVELEQNKYNLSISENILYELSKEQIINQAFRFHSEGNIQEAIKYYQLFINQVYEDHRVFSK